MSDVFRVFFWSIVARRRMLGSLSMHSRAFHFSLLFLTLLIAPLPAPGVPSFTETTFSTTDFDVMDQIDGNSTPTDSNDYYDANGNTLKDENGVFAPTRRCLPSEI